MTEVYELNTALRAVGRQKEAKDIGIVVSLGTGEPPLGKSCAMWNLHGLEQRIGNTDKYKAS